MNKHRLFFRYSFVFFVLVSCFTVIRHNPTLAAEQTQADFIVDFDFMQIPLEFHAPAIRALQQLASLPNSEFTITSLRQSDEWTELILVPTYVIRAGWEIGFSANEVVRVLINLELDYGTAGLLQSRNYENLAPDSLSDILQLTPPDVMASTTHLFPWTSGQVWWAIQGWHDNSNALDFQSTNYGGTPDIYNAILASGAGAVSQICNDGEQVTLSIDHGDGTSMYLHIQASSVPSGVIGQYVPRGRYLGYAYTGSSQENPVCPNYGYRYNTHCGCGYGTHLHYVAPSQSMTIDGLNINTIAGSASCCDNPPQYTSSNARINETILPIGMPTITSPSNGQTVITRPFGIVIQTGATNGRGTPEWQLQVDTDNTFTAPLSYDNIANLSRSTTIPVSLTDGYYCARSRQGNTIDPVSAWSSTVCFTVNTTADISISQSANPNPTVAGQNLTYTITVTNDGPSTATGVNVTDTLPAGTTLSAISASQGTCTPHATAPYCAIGTMNNGATATVTVVVQTNTNSTAALLNTVTVTSGQDNNAANNTSTLNLAPRRVTDTAITQTHSPGALTDGQNVTLSLVVTNNGASDAPTLTVTDTLPAETTYVSSDYAGCSHAAGVVTCTINNLAHGASQNIGITAAIEFGTEGTIVNTAAVDGYNDPTSANNSSTHNITVERRTGCQIADVNQSGGVNIVDLQLTANVFGSASGDGRYNQRMDANLDGVINIIDLQRVALQFGQTCS